MKEKYVGDSYDLVKHFFGEVLSPIAPLYAYPEFVRAEIRTAYTHVTGIPVLEILPGGRFGILLDPDTGIPLPDRIASCSHASLPFIVELNQKHRPVYMICTISTEEDNGRQKRAFCRIEDCSPFTTYRTRPFFSWRRIPRFLISSATG